MSRNDAAQNLHRRIHAKELANLREQMDRNRQTLWCFEAKEVGEAVVKEDPDSEAASVAKSLFSNKNKVESTIKLTAMMTAALGVQGTAKLRTFGAHQYILFHPLDAKATLINSIKSLLPVIMRKPKVIHSAVSNAAHFKGALKASWITAIAFTSIDVFRYIFDDKMTLIELLGEVGVDLAKIGAGLAGGTLGLAVGQLVAGIGVAAGVAVGGSMAVAAGPLVAAFFLGIGSSYIASVVIDHYDVKNRLIAVLESWAKEKEAQREANKKHLAHQKQQLRSIRQIDSPYSLYQLMRSL